jgi:uncharacterized protein (TIGR02391 family)
MFTPKQKSKLMDAIYQNGMHPDYFDLVDEESELRLTYKPARFYFRVVVLRLQGHLFKENKDLGIHYTPDFGGAFPKYDSIVTEQASEWQSVLVHQSKWLSWIKQEFYEQTERGQAELEEEREISEIVALTHLEPFHSNLLTHLHPAVQHAVGSRFADGYYSDALHKACTALEKAVQDKANQPTEPTGTTLMSKVFSRDKPLLTVSNNQGEQEGYMLLYRGLVQAIRNHYAHNDTATDPARALEWLSFVSALFYKLDESENIIK